MRSYRYLGYHFYNVRCQLFNEKCFLSKQGNNTIKISSIKPLFACANKEYLCTYAVVHIFIFVFNNILNVIIHRKYKTTTVTQYMLLKHDETTILTKYTSCQIIKLEDTKVLIDY